MKNIILYFVGGITMSFAQIGMNTETPQTNLHLEGSAQLTGSVSFGGDAETSGNPGVAGEILVSQGENKPPKWTSLEEVDIPSVVFTGTISGPTSSVAREWTSIPFKSNMQNLEYVSYDAAKREFRIEKSGYYEFSVFGSILISGISDFGGTLQITASGIGLSNEFGNPNSNNRPSIPLSGVSYLSKGTIVKLQMNFTRSYTIEKASISIIYVSQ